MVWSRVFANLGSFVLPIGATVLVPWALIGEWPSFGEIDPLHGAVGGALIAAGLSMLGWTVSLFIRIGRGTLAPWDPTRKLVVLGPYARVRNPMISGVFAIICGEAIVLVSRSLAGWAALFFGINHLYFIVSEEPGLLQRFGAEYEAYKRNVPRWIPRWTACARDRVGSTHGSSPSYR